MQNEKGSQEKTSIKQSRKTERIKEKNKKTRIVIDTNIFISGFFFEGNERRLMKAVYDGKYSLIISRYIIDEIERVLSQKFQVPNSKIRSLVEKIENSGELVPTLGFLNPV